MRKFLFVSVVASLLCGAAQAGIVCSIQDTVGNQLTYVFGPNLDNSVVETAFEKNGRMVISEVGNRPVWTITTPGGGVFSYSSQDAPGWVLSSNGYTDQAVLTHNGGFAGSGSCSVGGPDVPASTTVPDAGLND